MPSTVELPQSSTKIAARHFTPPVRPKFNTRSTSDRLREGSGNISTFSMRSNIARDRKSVFREVGLVEDWSRTTCAEKQRPETREHNFGELMSLVTDTTRVHANTSEEQDRDENEDSSCRTSSQQEDEATSPRSTTSNRSWYSKLVTGRRPRVKAATAAPPPTMGSLSRFTMIALLIAVVLPGFSYNNGREVVDISGADAGVIQNRRYRSGPILETRANSPTEVCTRWSHQAALLNGTLYIYGGQVKTTGDQANNTWNNNFLTLDLTKSWDTKSPALTGLPQPDGPPAVANGYLWHDYNNLFLYGGEFADNLEGANNYATPSELATWKYSVASKTWTKYADQMTSPGQGTDQGSAPVQRSGEGAGISVPELGLSWYFGGHLDWLTTPGWSTWTPRVYLKSLLEFTHPGYTNMNVQSLVNTGAGEAGAYRNITQGGLQVDKAFSERADGVLVFVPGWGESGVLLGLGGGSEETFSDDFTTLDVYDIKNSEWYHQRTKGEAPGVRVNPCAVIASAPDASSFQVYLYGGQNLQPYKDQTQYNDMYILTIPSFTWIRVPDQPSPPPARAGHTCNLRDGQIIVVGGYVGKTIPCDSPGIYVFNATSLEWKSSFSALSSKPDLHTDNSVLAASYGYKVPDKVVSVIGGSPDGGATVTTPASGPATGGPFATGHPPVYTVTASGSTATVTSWGPDTTGSVGGAAGDDHRPSGGLIAAGVIAGLAGLLAGYLGFCAWLYRRQVRAYKNHLAVANRYSGAGASKASFGGIAAFFGHKGSKDSKQSRGSRRGRAGLGAGPAAGGLMAEKYTHGHNDSTSTADSFAWVGREEPKAAWLSDEPTPGSGTGTTSSGAPRYSSSPFGDEARFGGYYGQQQYGSGSSSAVVHGGRRLRRGSDSAGSSTSSTEGLLDGQEPSFFSVVLGPRRALRVVNGLEEGE